MPEVAVTLLTTYAAEVLWHGRAGAWQLWRHRLDTIDDALDAVREALEAGHVVKVRSHTEVVYPDR